MIGPGAGAPTTTGPDHRRTSAGSRPVTTVGVGSGGAPTGRATGSLTARGPGLGPARLRARLRAGQTSVRAHVAAVLAAIERIDPELGAFLAVAGDEALDAAAAADRRLRELGRVAWDGQPLLGVTVAVKDLIQTRDLPTTRGSTLPNPRGRWDAPAVTRLRRAGAIIIGKTTTSEYGWSASTLGPLAAPTRNPWDLARTAGGSSGGSAAAVAAGLCDAALGTDGAGSIRIPAAFCGIVGFKPTFARVPYVPPCADRLAHLGPMTRDVAGAAELLSVLAGADPGDPDSASPPADPARRPGPVRVAWLEFPGTTGEVRRVTARARVALLRAGHRVDDIAVPFPDPYPALLDILAAAESAGDGVADSTPAAVTGATAVPGCGTDTVAPGQPDPGRLRIAEHGRRLRGADVLRAEQLRLALRVRLAEVMGRHDLLVMATVPGAPFAADRIAPPGEPDPLRWLAWSPACHPFNLTGAPALSLPAGLDRSGLPVGLQLVGAPGADRLVLDVAARLEADLGPPPRPGPPD